MRRPRHTTKLVTGALALIAVACLWFFFAPAKLGGRTSYVVTDGISMEPRFHAGDLVLVRSQSSYHVGQIVAYHSNVFHTVVLHRIIGRAGNRYVFKGDNNNFVDFEHPAQSQLIGALWVHLPGAGSTLESVRSPALIGVLVAAAVLLLMGAAFTQRRRRRRRARRAQEDVQHTPARASEPLLTALAVGFVALLPFVALALLAFTRPASAPQPASVAYQQSAAIKYTAAAKPGPAYTANRAVTGEPLFTHVVNDVDFRMVYHFRASAEHAVAGRASLYATIASTSGWQTTLKLGGPTYFRGDHTVVSGSLSLSSLLALMRNVEATTAVRGSYTLALTPHVTTNGSLGGLPLHTTFSPQAHFSVSQLEMQPIVAAGNAPGAGPAPSPLSPSVSGSATGRRYQPQYLSFGIARIGVATARAVALGAIVIISCILAAALTLLVPRRRDEADAIRSRYGRLIVPVARVWQEPGVAIIDVADMEALVGIAERYDRSILHETTEDGEAFWVTDESGQFRYAVGTTASGPGVPEPAATSFDQRDTPTDSEAADLDGAGAWPVELAPEPVTAVHARRHSDQAQAPPFDPEPASAVQYQPQVVAIADPAVEHPAVAADADPLVSEEANEWRAAYAAADANDPRPAPMLARHGR